MLAQMLAVKQGVMECFVWSCVDGPFTFWRILRRLASTSPLASPDSVEHCTFIKAWTVWIHVVHVMIIAACEPNTNKGLGNPSKIK